MPSPHSPRAAVIGHPIAHSRSPLLHRYWLRLYAIAGDYERIDVAPEALRDFISAMAGRGDAGCNVTVPHKQAVMPLLDGVTEAARAIGAVNTIWREKDRLRGDNTDAYGFLANLDDKAPGWDSGGGRAVILGAGGAARAAVFALLSRGFELTLVNRTRARADELARVFGAAVSVATPDDLAGHLPACNLLVNTTALGMSGKPPLVIDLASLGQGAIVHDIVYVPLETDLLRQARTLGHRTVDGLGMLIHQAVPGFERWFGVRPLPDAALRQLLEDDIRA